MPVNLSSLFSAVNEVSPVNNKEAQSAENAGNTSGAQNISGTIQKTADEAGIAMLKNMLKGMGISDGIGIGKAIILNNEDIKPEKIRTDDIEQEKKIFLDAIQSVKDETKNLISTLNGTEKDIME